MSFGMYWMRGAFAAGLLVAACPAWSDCRCDDGTTFRGGNGECKDNSICHLIDVPEVQRFGAEPAAPAAQPAPTQPRKAARQNAGHHNAKQPGPAAPANIASLCAKLPKGPQSEFMYRCDDGSIQESNDCPGGSMGHLFSPKAIVCKQHDRNRPNRIALSEFMGAWSTWVPGVAHSTDDYVNHVRTNHVSPGSAPVQDLVINANGTYTWKNKRGTWRETGDDANPILLQGAFNGHDWNVSIMEHWYGYLALSDASNPGDFYHGQR